VGQVQRDCRVLRNRLRSTVTAAAAGRAVVGLPPGATSSPGTSVPVPLPDEPAWPRVEPEWLPFCPAAQQSYAAAL